MLNNAQNSEFLEQNNPKIKLAEQQKNHVVPIKAGFTQFEVINAIYDSKILSEIKLTAGARLVLISLARHYNPANDEFFPSYTCISSHTGVSKKSVERAIKELVSAGLITYRTEKVNRYRFTGRFFASVKMTTHQRQNDDCDRGQNDAQTNNHEKRINNNKKVLNFSFGTAQAQNNTVTQVSSSSANGIVQKNDSFSKNEEVIKNSAAAGQNDGYQRNNYGKYYQQKACYQGGLVNSSQNRGVPRYNVPVSERSGGSSFTPSVSSTEEYLKEVRASRAAACSPLDFDFESAKRWYSSLSAPLRATSLAKRVAAKFPELLDS